VILTPYLADFPFEYYIVLESPDCLVDVLGDVIKQWISNLTGGY
jgi:midasin (ATPase involved in ribosome maturation)